MRIEPNSRALLLLSAAAILLGCNKQAPAANDSVNTTAHAAPANDMAQSDAANVASNSVAAAVGSVTPDFLIGKWSAMGEDCSATVEFRKDGTAITPIGKAKWTLTGDKLRFEYSDGSNQPPSTVRPVGKDRLQTITESGKEDMQKRC
jgi:hypothetical protein